MANTFESEVARSAQLQGLLYQKLVVPVVRRGGFEIKVDENPYDSYLVHRGRHIPLELKELEEHGSFPLSRVETHQVTGLEAAWKEGCRAWLLINMRCRHETRLLSKRTGETREVRVPDIRAWTFDFRQWPDLQAQLSHKNGKPRKSVPREWFDRTEWFTPLPRVKVDGEYIWDLTVLLEPPSYGYYGPGRVGG